MSSQLRIRTVHAAPLAALAALLLAACVQGTGTPDERAQPAAQPVRASLDVLLGTGDADVDDEEEEDDPFWPVW